MKKFQKATVAFITTTALMTTGAEAAVSQEEAKQLGTSLTAVGAEVSGNQEGSIPAYAPKPLAAPADWDRKTQGYPDPWKDKPLFTITAQNASQYAEKIGAMSEVFKRYPNYRMDVYAAYRTAYFPKHVQDNTLKNATSCKGVQDDLKLEGCYGGVPFPIPKSGRQLMWNHLTSYAAPELLSEHVQTFVTTASGKAVLQTTFVSAIQRPMDLPEKAGTAFPSDAPYFKTRAEFVGPARQVGIKILLVNSLDTLGVGARAWQYIPGQRRVKLAPDLAYDTPSPTSGGAATMDEQQGFMGAVDRYDFKLAGKSERYIPYNNFKLTDPRVCPDEKVTANPNYPIPDCIRWELHRVWKVDAKLKPGFRHIYPQRAFYWDEDGYGCGATENWDAAGKLYRVGYLICYPFFNTGGMSSTSGVVMDVVTGNWTLQGGLGSGGGAWVPVKPKSELFYSAESLAGEGVR